MALATCPFYSDIRPTTVFGNGIPALRMGSYLPVSLSVNTLVAEPVITRSTDNNGLFLDWLTQHLFPDPCLMPLEHLPSASPFLAMVVTGACPKHVIRNSLGQSAGCSPRDSTGVLLLVGTAGEYLCSQLN